MPAVALHKTLPKPWRPGVSRVRKIRKHLVSHSGGCVSWGGDKTGKRDARLVFNKRKYSVRVLLYLWETGRTALGDKRVVKASCKNSWCIKPLHQECRIASKP